MRTTTLGAVLLWGLPLFLRAADAGSSFEAPGSVDARRFLPAAVFDSKRHPVSPEAFNDGLVNAYSVRSGGSDAVLNGAAALLERWGEMRAIDQLRQVTGSQAFRRALKQSAKETGVSARRLLANPVGALRRAPEGAKRFFGRIGDTLRGDEGDESGEGALAGALGVSDAKRKLAVRLGVDPDSVNEVLQADLERVARAQALGGLTLDAGSLFVTGPAAVALTAAGVSQDVDALLESSTPEELRRKNRQMLRSLGAGDEAATAFFEHAWYTPRDETIIIWALRMVAVNPEPYLNAACQAHTRADALFYRNVARLAAAYHRRAAALREFRTVDGVLCLLDQGGALVLPVSFDYLQWTEPVARVADAFADPARRGEDVKSVVLWTDGQLSARAGAELSQRNVAVQASVGLAGD